MSELSGNYLTISAPLTRRWLTPGQWPRRIIWFALGLALGFLLHTL